MYQNDVADCPGVRSEHPFRRGSQDTHALRPGKHRVPGDPLLDTRRALGVEHARRIAQRASTRVLPRQESTTISIHRRHAREVCVHSSVGIVVILDHVPREFVHRQCGLRDGEAAEGAVPLEALLGVAGAVGCQVLYDPRRLAEKTFGH